MSGNDSPSDNDPRGRRKRPFDSPFSGDFNDFFKYIQRMLEDFMSSELSDDFNRSFGDKEKPFVWGFTFNRDIDGRPRFERFGTFSTDKAASDEDSTVREPLTDVLEESGTIRVISELPGISKEEIDLRATEHQMILKANGENGRSFKKELKFSRPIIPESTNAKFKNGVLEIEFKRKDAPNTSQKISIQ